MNSQLIFDTILALLFPILVIWFPDVGSLGSPLIIAGFALVTITYLIGIFRRYKWGPFHFYKEPLKFLGTTFTKLELRLFRLGLFATFSGLATIGVLLLRMK